MSVSTSFCLGSKAPARGLHLRRALSKDEEAGHCTKTSRHPQDIEGLSACEGKKFGPAREPSASGQRLCATRSCGK